MFSHARNLDVRGSNIAHAGRDQHIVQNTIIIDSSIPERERYQLLHDLCQVPRSSVSPSRVLSQTHLLPQAYRFETGCTSDIAFGLIDTIKQLMADRTTIDSDHHLKHDLDTLRQTLTLARLAIDLFRSTPLGRSLAGCINPEVDRCCTVLQELLDSIRTYRQGLFTTYIRDLWYHVWWSGWWSGWGEDEFLSLRTKLLENQKSLEGFLMALQSVAWIDIGNELRTGHVPLARFRDLLTQRLPFLGHIKINSIHVVDHLGQSIPVPTIFCSNWKSFDYIIKGYSKDRYGDHHVRWGDYEVINAEDGQVVQPSEFVSAITPEMVLEISIILRQDERFQYGKQKCPRCNNINLDATVKNGWIECCKCVGKFRVVQTQLDHGGNDNGEHDDLSENNPRNHGETNQDHEATDEEIFSPACQAGGKIISPDSGCSKRLQNDDGIQFFRRIRVVCMNLTGQVRLCFPENFNGDQWGTCTNIFNGEYYEDASVAAASLVAVKILRVSRVQDQQRDSEFYQRFKRQFDIWPRLKHPNIQPFLGYCSDLRRSIALISPFCTNGNIMTYIAKNPSCNKLHLVKEVAIGLKYLHSRNVIHCNLYPRHVLVDGYGHAVLTSFGSARVVGDPTYNNIPLVGVAEYWAPELLPRIDMDVNKLFSKKSDVYAFGMLCFEVLTNHRPFAFYGVHHWATIDLIQRGKKPVRTSHAQLHIPDDTWMIMEACWTTAPEDRPSASQIVQRMQ